MNLPILDLRKPVEALRDGLRLHDVVGLILQLLVVAAGVALVGVWFGRWSPGTKIGFFGWIALIVWQVAWPLAVFLALQALFLRALEIRKLPPAQYTVAPMVEKMLRGFGEAAMAFLAVLAVPALLVVWFSGRPLLMHLLPSLPNLISVMPWLGEGGRFWTGILALAALPAQGLITLIGCYFSAEAVIALFAIAEDVRVLRGRPADADSEPETAEAPCPACAPDNAQEPPRPDDGTCAADTEA